MNNTQLIYTFAVILVIAIIIAFIRCYLATLYEEKVFDFVEPKNNKINVGSVSCDAKTCGAIDPVSDPKYNMTQIIKQSILLEEHISNKNKRCKDCITKHFLHIIGLIEEAQMLATKDIEKFPHINESVEVYNNLFKNWLSYLKSKNEKDLLEICHKLRDNRKKLIAVYVIEEFSK
jgi:hypothetical protein